MDLMMGADGKLIKVTEKDYNNHMDTVQVLLPHPNDTAGIFLSAGWDGIVKIWQVNGSTTYGKLSLGSSKTELINSFQFSEPVLSLAVSLSNLLFVGLSSGVIQGCSLSDNKPQFHEITRHNAGVIFMAWVEQFNFLLSLAMNDYLIVNQMGDKGFNDPIYIKLPQKTVCASFSFPYLVICSQYRMRVFNLAGFDMNNIGNYDDVAQNAESKINSVAILADARMVVVGTLDARAYWFQFQDNGGLIFKQTKSQHTIDLTKKVHHSSISKSERYPVNCIEILHHRATHQRHTSVCFGIGRKLMIYSLPSKEELKALRTNKEVPYVTAVKHFSLKGTSTLIIATGNNWENGMESMNKQIPNAIEIKEVVSKDLGKYLQSF